MEGDSSSPVRAQYVTDTWSEELDSCTDISTVNSSRFGQGLTLPKVI